MRNSTCRSRPPHVRGPAEQSSGVGHSPQILLQGDVPPPKSPSNRRKSFLSPVRRRTCRSPRSGWSGRGRGTPSGRRSRRRTGRYGWGGGLSEGPSRHRSRHSRNAARRRLVNRRRSAWVILLGGRVQTLFAVTGSPEHKHNVILNTAGLLLLTLLQCSLI